MKYIEPKQLVSYLLRTGDSSVLTKVDPARRHELAFELKKAQQLIKAKISQAKAPNRYQQLLKSQSRPSAPVQENSWRGLPGFAQDWNPGDTWFDVLGIPCRTVPLKKA